MDDDRHWEGHPRWSQAVDLAGEMVERGDFRGISFQAFGDTFSPLVRLGRCDESNPLSEHSLFLVASLTKPVVATAVVQLAERGLFSLNERISEFLPEWNQNKKRRITIRHLLCHASGLPDQLPDNLQLRAGGASLDEFYQQVVKVPLDFAPGTRAQYQSMGYLVLSRLVETLTGQPLRQLLREQIFEPLGMASSYLGLADDEASEILPRVAQLELNEEQDSNAGNWNSDYWRKLGAPWGGMISTADDLAKFCYAQVDHYVEGHQTAISGSLVDATSSNQLTHLTEMAERDRVYRPWGLGWRLNWLAHRESFGDFLGDDAIGHWGATGTLMWVDKMYQSGCVICTTKPSDLSTVNLIRLSNALSVSIC